MIRRWGGLIVLAAISHAAEPSFVQALALSREGTAALEAGDRTGSVERLEAAVALRPDHPEFLFDLARAYLAAERADDALGLLGRLARLGLAAPEELGPAFASLKSRREFQALLASFAASTRPSGRGSVVRSLRDVTGWIEGIACARSSGNLYFGDVHHRCVWVANKEGVLRRLTPEGDALLGVFGVVVDESAGVVWAATSAVPGMRGYTDNQMGQAALAEIDLASGEVRRTWAVPSLQGMQPEPVLSDLALGSDGSVWAVGPALPFLWKLEPGSEALKQVAENGELLAPQAVAVFGRNVLVGDQVNGLVRVDGAGAMKLLIPPEGVTLIEITSLAALEGRLVALQTGVKPARVLEVRLQDDAEEIVSVRVIDAAHLAMVAPTQGCLGPEGDFLFVGNGGRSRVQARGDGATAPRLVPVLSSRLSP